MSLRLRQNSELSCFLLILLCFLMTSAGYLSWVYHLAGLAPEWKIDLLSEVYGYCFQAAGLGLFALVQRRRRPFSPGMLFLIVLLGYLVSLIPALLSEGPWVVLIWGYIMNLFCGILAGFYLYRLSMCAKNRCGFVFGAGYGLSCLALWLLSLSGRFLQTKTVLILYAVLAVATFWTFDKNTGLSGEKNPADDGRLDRPDGADDGYSKLPAGAADDSASKLSAGAKDGAPILPAGANEKKPNSNGAAARSNGAAAHLTELILTAFLTVILLSLVKNLGFAFPLADIGRSVDLELSRVFYGAGLILAGIINDRSRKHGAILCLASLVIPFLSLFLSDASFPAMLLWCLNYFFYGFFSVYRVILFSDLAKKEALPCLAVFGLLAGRLGDASGTVVHLLLKENAPALVIVAAVFFIFTVFLFFRLFFTIYTAAQAPAPSDQERFQQFVLQYDCSSRERDVLRLLLEEHSNSEIAATLFVTESTVKYHVRNILKKTGCSNRKELYSLYHR